MISGPRVDMRKFVSGWLLTGLLRKGHYFDRTEGNRSLCGRATMNSYRDRAGFVFFHPGDFPRCKLCQKKIEKEAEQHE